MAKRLANSLVAVLLLGFQISLSSGKVVSGELDTRTDWLFVARFCFKDSYGQMQYNFEYPEEYATQNILLYFDNQWPRVYPQIGMSCLAREDKLYRGNNQVINLTTTYMWSGCRRELKNNVKMLVCEGDRRFLSMRARWWYIVLSNCDGTKGLKLKFHLNLTNGNDFWTMHWSADERHVLKMDIAFLLIFGVIIVCAIHVTYILISRRLFHYTYKLFLWSLFLESFSLCLFLGYYVNYGKTGYSNYGLQVAARGLHYVAHIVFLVLLILVAKGWTVTRGRISSSGQVKLGIFATLYTISFIILFIYESVIFDPAAVLYIYESPAGVGICVLRVIAWLWFCYGTFFTLKHFPSKSTFYYPFWFFYTGWFLAGPVIVLIATYVIQKWAREQVVHGIEWGVSILAHVFFLGITRPAAANRNFPFHMRTNQIGIIEGPQPSSFPLPSTSIPHPHPSAMYTSSYSTPMSGSPPSQTFTDITAMFMATTHMAPTPQGLYSNGVSNGSITGNAALAFPPNMNSNATITRKDDAPPPYQS